WPQHGNVGSHLRRIHYRLVTMPINLPSTGKPYTNTPNDWQYLVKASLSARYLDLIPFDALTDQRNAEPIFNAPEGLDPNEDRSFEAELTMSLAAIDYPEMPVSPSFEIRNLTARQDCIVEVWIEKSTQNDWLAPLCRSRGINLVVGIGESSEI